MCPLCLWQCLFLTSNLNHLSIVLENSWLASFLNGGWLFLLAACVHLKYISILNFQPHSFCLDLVAHTQIYLFKLLHYQESSTLNV